MGQNSSVNSGFRGANCKTDTSRHFQDSSQSYKNSLLQEIISVLKLVQSSSAEDLSVWVGTPKTSSHEAFKRFIGDKPSFNHLERKNILQKSPTRTEGPNRREEKKKKNMSSVSTAQAQAPDDLNGGFPNGGASTPPSAVSSAASSSWQIDETEAAMISAIWPKIEPQLLSIGIRIFISILENKNDKMPICSDPDCTCSTTTEGSGKVSGCPRQVILNEEIQRFVLMLMGFLRKIVKYLNHPQTVQRLLRRAARKQFHALKFDLGKLDSAAIAVQFCHALRDLFLPTANVWNGDLESAFANLIKGVVCSLQKLIAGPESASPSASSEIRDFAGTTDEEQGSGSWSSSCSSSTPLSSSATSSRSNSSISLRQPILSAGTSGTSSLWESSTTSADGIGEARGGVGRAASSSSSASFDKHTVLFGCQTFQEFFDIHPEILNYFDQFALLKINESGFTVAEALKIHASRVLAIVEEIIENSGDPEKIRTVIEEIGKEHKQQGITEEHLDMLGPVVCHTVRPLVFRAGLWSIEIEKSWNHLFDMIAVLMKRGYVVKREENKLAEVTEEDPSTEASRKPKPYRRTAHRDFAANDNNGGLASAIALMENGFGMSGNAKTEKAIAAKAKKDQFPTLTHVIILKDTWMTILEQMHALGMNAVIKLFKINYNLKFFSSPRVRYRPQKLNEDTEHLSILFNVVISIIDHVIGGLSTQKDSSGTEAGGSGHGFAPSQSTSKSINLLKEPMEWIGPVFCNTVRPLLLVQGKWSYQVEMAWRMLFQKLVKKSKEKVEEVNGY